MSEKAKMAIWLELYKKTELSPGEIEYMRDQLASQGVVKARINPKALTNSQLIGVINEESMWCEGIFTTAFRDFCTDSSMSRKWIHLDGPLDVAWVENFNSILDDNARLNLPMGETLKMTDKMCLIFESDNLKNITPVTVSRCGVVYLTTEEHNNPKCLLNQYLNRAPPNLKD